jgi:hypothetical protein
MKSLVLTVLALCAISAYPKPLQADPLYVGVLEQYHDHWNDEKAVPDIRMAFTKSDSGWQALPSMPPDEASLKSLMTTYPKSVTWTVIYNGKALGKLVGVETGEEAYASLGKQNVITINTPIPTVTTGIDNFGQWIGGAKYRPLVLVTNQNHSDPDQWTRCTPTAAEIQLGLSEFRKVAKKANYCVTKMGNDVFKSRPYADKEVLIDRTFHSKAGEVLLGLYLNPKIDNCDGLPEDEDLERWYVIQGTRIQFLGTNLTPMDAVDLDGDGKSEWVFSYSGYNRDGYVLFWNNFKQKSEYLWNYH